ncbi:MAG TPA: hypothetical protein V6D00_16145 [Pantanalinema sp.]
MFKKASALVLTVSALGLVGCGALPGTTTPPSAKDAQINGRVTHLGKDPGQELTLSLKRFDGSSFQRLGTSTRSDRQGQYAFSGLSAGKYQVFYDDQGEVVDAADVNTVGAYVDASVQVVEIGANGSATSNFDVGWQLSPTIKPNDALRVGGSDRFSFSSKYGDSDAEYQVLVADGAKRSVWSSAWTKSTSFAWNGNGGSETNSPTQAYAGTGAHFYQVKFRKAATTFGGDGYYGQTKWIPFSVTR